MTTPLVIIPARVGSVGVPNKNFAKLPDQTTLLGRAVEIGRHIGSVVVTTDCDWLTPELTSPAWSRMCDEMHMFKDAGWLTIHKRDPKLAQDDTPMSAVVEDVLATIPGPPDQPIVLLQPTVPFRTVEQVLAALGMVAHRHTIGQSVATVRSVPEPYSRAVAVDRDGEIELPKRRQDATPLYLFSGTAYAWQRGDSRFPKFWTPLVESGEPYLNVDELADWHALITHIELARTNNLAP